MGPILDIMSKSYITTLQMPKSTVFLSKVAQSVAEMRKAVHGYKGQEPRRLEVSGFLLTRETGKKTGNLAARRNDQSCGGTP
jgi:hypothetical protein